MPRSPKLAFLPVASLVFLLAAVTPSLAVPDSEDALKARQIVTDSAKVVQDIKGSPQSKGFRDALSGALGILVIPDFYKGGLIVGGATGEGVLLTRTAVGAAWGQPAFFRLFSGSVGLQAGLKESELVLVVRSKAALDKFMEDKAMLGVEGGIAVATVGAGVGAGSTSNVDADVVVFAQSQGAFVGVSVEGSVLSASDDLNAAYHGRPITTEEIVNGRGTARRGDAAALRNAL